MYSLIICFIAIQFASTNLNAQTKKNDYAAVVEVKDYKLNQNYPNPFNPTTKITYALPEKTVVTIKVFDILGNEIVQLVNEVKDAGNHEIEFNAKNLSSGVYLYQLKTDKIKITKKLTLSK